MIREKCNALNNSNVIEEQRGNMKTKVLQLDNPKTEWVESYQQLDILATLTGHDDLWDKHYPFKKWITHKSFPEVDMDNDDFPDGIFGEDNFCDQELIQEWIDDTHQPFKLMSMPDQRGFYFYVPGGRPTVHENS